MRLQAAVKFLRDSYGRDILPPSAESDCRIIPAIRGSFAHGDDPFLGRHADKVFETTILTETICYLLTIKLLGIQVNLNLGADHLLTDSLRQLSQIAKTSPG